MADNSQKGLGSDKMDSETKFEIQSEGGQASHSGGRQSQGGTQGNKGGQSSGQSNQQGSSDRGFAAMKEEGRDEEVSEIASLGGQSSHGGGRNQGE